MRIFSPNILFLHFLIKTEKFILQILMPSFIPALETGDSVSKLETWHPYS
jgi:hypothetical protein